LIPAKVLWSRRQKGVGGSTYGAASGLLVAALASDLEGNIVGGVALELNGTSRKVVEVLVEQLNGARRNMS